MKPLDLSLCMIVKNEEDVLSECLQSVKDIVKEIIIVDTGSTDRTKDIAKNMGAIIIDHAFEGDFSKARNIGLSLAKSQWILVLDADERWDIKNNKELLTLLNDETIYGYFVKMVNYYGASPDQEYVIDTVCRLFRNIPEIYFQGMIHEEITNSIRTFFSKKKIAFSNLKIHHYGYLDTVIINKQKNDRNIEIVKRALKESPNDSFLHYALGTEFFQIGEYQKALTIYQSVLNHASDKEGYFSDLLLKTVCCLKELQLLSKALSLIKKGKDSFPDFVDLLVLEAQILIEQDEYVKAEEILIQCKQIGDVSHLYTTTSSGGTSIADYLLGIVRERQWQWAQALDYYESSYAFDQQLKESLIRWTNIMMVLEKDRRRFFQRVHEQFGRLHPNEWLIILKQARRWGRSDIHVPLIKKLEEVNFKLPSHLIDMYFSNDKTDELWQAYLLPHSDLQSLIRKTSLNLQNYDYSCLLIITWGALKVKEWTIALNALHLAKKQHPKRLEHVMGYILLVNGRNVIRGCNNIVQDLLLLS